MYLDFFFEVEQRWKRTYRYINSRPIFFQDNLLLLKIEMYFGQFLILGWCETEMKLTHY